MERGEVRSLREYLDMFPGQEAAVAAEFLALERHRSLQSEPAGTAATLLTTSSRLGPYVLGEQLGSGAQSVVYGAVNVQTHGRVALKVLKALGPADSDAARRFRREATAAAKLDHPGLCPVYGADVVDGIPYIAMKWIDGETLEARIRRSRSTTADRAPAGTAPDAPAPLVRLATSSQRDGSGTPSPSSQRSSRSALMRVLEFVERAARAIHVAHEAGIVHRDIKPANIMVTQQDEPVVMDFGLAWDADSEFPSLTRTGDLLGTPPYMSPEQLTRHSIRLDRRTDVWSLGVTMYECVTLRRPFDAPTREALYQQVLTKEPINPRRHHRGLPRDLVTVIETALEKDRDRRYQTALELAEDLRRIREYEPINARPASRLTRVLRWAQREPAMCAVVVVLVLAASVSSVLAWLHNREARAAEAARLEAEAARLDADQLAEVAATRAVEGRQLAMALLQRIEPQIRRVPGATGARTLLADTGLSYLDGLRRGAAEDPDLLRELAEGYMVVGSVNGGADNGNLGRARDALDSFDKALDIYRELGGEAPDADEGLLLRTAAAYGQRGDVLGNPFATNLGHRAEARHSYQRARELFEQAVRRRPEDPSRQLDLAHILLRTGDAFIPYTHEVEPYYLARWRRQAGRHARVGAAAQALGALLGLNEARRNYAAALEVTASITPDGGELRDQWLVVEFTGQLRWAAVELLRVLTAGGERGPSPAQLEALRDRSDEVMRLAQIARQSAGLGALQKRAESFAIGLQAVVSQNAGDLDAAVAAAERGRAATEAAFAADLAASPPNVEAIRDVVLAIGGTAMICLEARQLERADRHFRDVVPRIGTLLAVDRTAREGHGTYSPVQYLLGAAFCALDLGDRVRAREYLRLACAAESQVESRRGIVLFELERLSFLLDVLPDSGVAWATGDLPAAPDHPDADPVARRISIVARGVAAHAIGHADAAALLAEVDALRAPQLDPEERRVAALACDALATRAAGAGDDGGAARWEARGAGFRQ
ncbi:MAG: protein kinase [Planctomycetota bacterium]